MTEAMDHGKESQRNNQDVLFKTTKWSLVMAARQGADAQATDALEQLCRVYWPPIYAYIRRLGRSPHDAQDLTQEFFHHLLKGDLLQRVDRQKGKFRGFLLTSIRHFLHNQWDRANTLKRGGAAIVVSIDDDSWESLASCEEESLPSPEEAFDRRWMSLLIQRATDKLRQEQEIAGSVSEFEAVHDCLLGCAPHGSYEKIAAAQGTTKTAIAKKIQRLRERLRALIRTEVAQTVAHLSQVDEELGLLRKFMRVRP